MNHDDFIQLVEEAAGIDRDTAERAARATLQTLSERIADGEVVQAAERLPEELRPAMAPTGAAERFGFDEFLSRVGEREGVDPATAEKQVRAVFLALRQAIGQKELDDIAAELPKEFFRVLPAGPYVGVVRADHFLKKVADRTGLDEEGARRATEAVLETLAERIAGGEVEDLMARLPVELHEPLRRGMAHSGGNATRMSLDEFLSRIATREGVDEIQARVHARAELETLREAVGDDEFRDVIVELPQEYRAQLVPAP
jgi:uncharacterized protein (DUF2267 family)